MWNSHEGLSRYVSGAPMGFARRFDGLAPIRLVSENRLAVKDTDVEAKSHTNDAWSRASGFVQDEDWLSPVCGASRGRRSSASGYAGTIHESTAGTWTWRRPCEVADLEAEGHRLRDYATALVRIAR